MRLPLVGGSYQARSIIANAQRCINYFPELNRKDSPWPFTMYQRGGLRPKASNGATAPVRGLYQASNGAGYTVIGSNVYYVKPDWTLQLLGTITPAMSNPVSFIDNGTDILLVDSSLSGWTINLLTNAFALVVDGTGSFQGARRVDTLDTYVLWNKIGTQQFGSTQSGIISPFISLMRGAKATYPDALQTLIVRKTEIILLGLLKGEIWYNVGGAILPFARLPGAYIQHGIAAPYSVSSSDINVFWVSRNLDGQGLILRLKNYEVQVISNPAIAWALSKMSSISDAIGYCVQVQGHLFCVFHFPSGDQTWVYDAMIEDPEYAWHQEAWADVNGDLHRHRANCFAMINGVPCVGDWQYGTLYQIDPTYYVDTVNGVDYPIACIRTFPHPTQALDNDEMVDIDGKSVVYQQFQADLEVGNGALVAGNPAGITLRWSDDSGKSFLSSMLQSAGAPGEYRTTVVWPAPLGQTNKRVFELSHSIAGEAALQGAWIQSAKAAI